MSPAPMWQMRRVRLERIGPTAARFLDVTLDFTGADGHPLDSILWLRNGGGKSTVLSLICALIRPHRRDFLATAATGKHLEDYVLGADTAHVVVEWSGPDGRRLVTGAVYEWADRSQPADPNRDHDRLSARWYLFRPDTDGRASLDTLPFETDGRPTAQKEFVAAVRAWDVIPNAGVAVTDGQDRWSRMLDEHGLDPAIFTALLQMNATEGGIEGQFQFRSADQFVRYLLELIVDPEVPGQVSEILERVRAGLAERPQLLADLTFADEATPLLHRLAENRAAHSGAETAHRELEGSAVALATAVAAAVAGAERAAAGHEDRITELCAAVAEHRDRAALAESRVRGLRRIAAEHRRASAQRAAEAARAAQQRASAQKAAWRAVPEVRRLRDARARVTSLAEQLAAATADAEPLRVRRDEAAAEYARSLDVALSEHDEQAAGLADTVAATREAETAARTRARAATADQGRLTGELAAVTAALADLDAALGAARTQGLLDAEEDVAAAIARHETADADAAADLERLREDRPRLRERRQEIVQAADELAAERRTLTEARRADAERVATLREVIDELAGDDRLRTLSGGDLIEPVAEAGDLVELLTTAISRSERQRIELAVEGAEDERSLAALAATGLLPATLDLVRAHETVEAAGIGATTGWRYLAESVSAAEHAAVLRAAPALAAGLLVHDPADLGTAEETLAAAGLRPTSPVVVATTADLQAVVDAGLRAQTPFLVPPAAALLDPAAAGSEIGAREAARAGRAAADVGLVALRERDDELRRRLRALRTDCPPGTLETLQARISDAEARLAAITEDLARVEADRASVEEQEHALDERRAAQEEIRRVAAVAGAVLAGLGARLARSEPIRARARALPGEIEVHRAAIERAAAEEDAQRRTGAEAAQRLDAVRRAVSGYREARSALSLAEERSDGLFGSAAVAAVPLAEARRAYESAEQAYRREVSDSALAASLEEARRAVEEPSARVAGLSTAVRESATDLADTAEAADPGSLAAALARAEEAADRAGEAVGAAKAELRAAEAELATFPAPDETLPADELPADRAAALAAAEVAEEDLAGLRAAVEACRGEVEAEKARHAEARERHTGLAHQAELLGVAPGEQADGAPDPGGVEDVRVAVAAIRGRIDAVAADARRARALVEKVAREIVVWASAERFAEVNPTVRDRFRVTDVAGELGPEAGALSGELELFAANLRGRLEELEEHKSVVVTAMTGMVRQALKSLARAQSLSELPESLGAWAGHRFLDVGPRSAVETADAVVRDRCARLVDALTARGAEVPRGQELLWQATNAVVGDGNWRARVLKPSTALALERVSVERMRKWSGGEKVTISLLLFCMVAKLRATSRGRDLPGLGALPLDNPLGKANYVVFLDLQRKVAAANGVQLIFLTGVGDMKAVGRFPNVIRMRNTANRGREYVRVADRTLAGEDPSGAVDTTRIHRDDPVLTLL
ncbi:MAG: hypothetical protein OJJ54_02320 [Pseudonocardia sp.]|nr:hypothetical protein [Pseudonocardia sp.]